LVVNLPPRLDRGSRAIGVAVGDVVDATEEALAAAGHLTKMDRGAIETLRVLARKIDTEDDLRDKALNYAEAHEQKPPAVDNVSIPTYLKFCESLGLTPAGRLKLGPAKETAGGKLGQLRSVAGGKS
jgi:hypothetical protein